MGTQQALQVSWLDSADWEALWFRLYFDWDLSDEIKDALSTLIHSWSVVASYGCFGGVIHYISDLGYEEDDTERYLEWWVDMGTTTTSALDALIRCLEQFSQARKIEFTGLMFGQKYTE